MEDSPAPRSSCISVAIRVLSFSIACCFSNARCCAPDLNSQIPLITHQINPDKSAMSILKKVGLPKRFFYFDLQCFCIRTDVPFCITASEDENCISRVVFYYIGYNRVLPLSIHFRRIYPVYIHIHWPVRAGNQYGKNQMRKCFDRVPTSTHFKFLRVGNKSF